MRESMRIAVRAFTVPARWKVPTGRGGLAWRKPKQEYVLVLDTETTIGPEQALLFGFYRFAKIIWDKDTGPRAVCLEEGIVHADDLAVSRPEEYSLLFTYANSRKPDVDPAHLVPGTDEPARSDLRMLSRRDFIDHVLVPAL